MSNIFMKIEGVTGESIVFGHEGEIDVISWEWGMHQLSRDHTSSTKKATIEHISFVHEIDLASNGLMHMFLQNKLAPKALLSFRRPDAQSPAAQGLAGKVLPPPDYLKIHLDDVMVNRIEPFGSTYGHYERVTVSFNAFKREYIPQTAQGVSSGVASVQYRLGYA